MEEGDGGRRYLVDTSAWLDALQPRPERSGVRERVRTLLAADQVVLTGVVRAEILRGTRDEVEYTRLAAMLDAIERLPSTEADWDDAGRVGFRLRRAGRTANLPDLVIASVALRHDVTVLHSDSDFDALAHHIGLRVESHVG